VLSRAVAAARRAEPGAEERTLPYMVDGIAPVRDRGREATAVQLVDDASAHFRVEVHRLRESEQQALAARRAGIDELRQCVSNGGGDASEPGLDEQPVKECRHVVHRHPVELRAEQVFAAGAAGDDVAQLAQDPRCNAEPERCWIARARRDARDDRAQQVWPRQLSGVRPAVGELATLDERTDAARERAMKPRGDGRREHFIERFRRELRVLTRREETTLRFHDARCAPVIFPGSIQPNESVGCLPEHQLVLDLVDQRTSFIERCGHVRAGPAPTCCIVADTAINHRAVAVIAVPWATAAAAAREARHCRSARS
jgi:hypothetical protein